MMQAAQREVSASQCFCEARVLQLWEGDARHAFGQCSRTLMMVVTGPGRRTSAFISSARAA